MKNREIKYDLLRAVAVMAIIMVHTIPSETVNDKQWWFVAVMQPLLLSFVGVYFMLSGLFLLDSSEGDITEFYKNRARVIVIPFFFYTVLYYIYDAWRSRETLPLRGYLVEYLRGFFSGSIPMTDHMWFMYVLLALYLCTPFLARMMKAMSDKELKYFLVLILVLQTLVNYASGFGIGLDSILQYMIFKGWFIYYILGYALKRLFKREWFKWFALAGILGMVLTLLQKRLIPDFAPGIHDMALTMFAMSAAVFLFFKCYGNLTFCPAVEAVSWISRHSYSAYLIHYLFLKSIAEGVIDQTMARHYYVVRILCVTVLTAALSFLAAWIFDSTLLKRMQN